MREWCSKCLVAAAAALAGLLSACGSTVSTYAGPGGVPVNGLGRELFTYHGEAGEAARYPCAAECSPAWTPLYAGILDRAEGDFSIFVRDDGHWQWAYLGQPIYFYSGRMRALADDPQMNAGLWIPLASASTSHGLGW